MRRTSKVRPPLLAALVLTASLGGGELFSAVAPDVPAQRGALRPVLSESEGAELETRRSRLLVRSQEARLHHPPGDIHLILRTARRIQRGILFSRGMAELDLWESRLHAFLRWEGPRNPEAVDPESLAEALDRHGLDLGVYALLVRSGVAQPRALLLALIRTESSFDPDSVSPAGAVGLMQVLPRTALELGFRTDLTDAESNIRAGLTYLRESLRTFGRLDHALAGYNCGIGRVRSSLDRDGRLPDIRETRDYVRKVMDEYGRLLRASARGRPAPQT